MKLLLDIRSIARCAAASLAVASLLSACSLMHDDLPQCATRPETRATVNFIYDYNTACEDRFADNVGTVTLFVFDENDHLVTFIEHNATANGILEQDYSMPLDLPAGKYHLYASARENREGYEASLLTPGAKFRRDPFATGDPSGAFTFSLDNNSGVVDNAGSDLEQFWLTQIPTELTVTEAPMPAEGDPQPADVLIQTAVPLQRVTNRLHLTITRENGADANLPTLSASDYDVWVETRTGRHQLDLLGRPTAAATPLLYRPHHIGMASAASAAPAEAPASARNSAAIEADIAMSRLILDADPQNHTRLCIKSRLSGETFTFDLPALLARGAEAYASKGWSAQEYLDREYDYHLTVPFSEHDDGWRYIEVTIPILNWAKRIQNESL